MPGVEGNLWLYETNPAFGAMQAYWGVSYLTAPQQLRLERIRQSTMLYRGLHREYFLGEGRTQFEFPPVMVGNRNVIPYVKLNVLKLLSKKVSDLLFGEEPLISCDDDIQEARLTDLLERSSFNELLKNTAVECSYQGEAFFEVCLYEGQVHIQRIPCGEIYPNGALQPDRQYASYTRYRRKNIGSVEEPTWLLLEITFGKGSITRALWQTDDDGRKLSQVDLSVWDKVDPEPQPLQPVSITGIAANTITWVPNELDEDQAVSDYDGLIELQDTLNAKQTQLSRVFSQHSDPAIAIPEAVFDEQGNIRSKYKAFPFSDPNMVPKYITWDAQLDGAIKDRSFALNALLIIAEMSPALLGLKEGAAPDAYKKLRLEANNALSMAKRKASTWRPRIKRLLSIAQQLEQTIPGNRYDQQPITVQPQDGIPVDDLDQANVIAILRAAKVMSQERAVSLLIPDKAEQAKEIARLGEEGAEDQAMAALMSPPAPGGGEMSDETGGDGGATRADPTGSQLATQDGSNEPTGVPGAVNNTPEGVAA